MTKALIIACCGLVLALIFGATTQSRAVLDENAAPHFLLKKCMEPVNLRLNNASCAISAHVNVRADMFLRELKRKIRRAYV